ncbi:MAG: hypothetical protein CL609_01610 [Anaerolineaceae bacterium]|nr:hypothetical protein [Anaerolineaceae bacterium]
MQKIFKILFFISIFIICLSIGVFLTKQVINPEESTITENSENQQLQSANQMKLIVFLVDEIEQKKPQLESVWGVNLYLNEPHQLTFIPLTDISENDFKKLSKRFYITDKKELSEATLNYFEKYFLTSWDGSLIVDQDAVSYFYSWLTENQITVTGTQSESNDKFINLTSLCDYLNQKTSPPSKMVDWQNMSSKDFLTSLSVDEVLLGLQAISGNTSPKCKLILNNQ